MDFTKVEYKSYNVAQTISTFERGDVTERHSIFSPIVEHPESFEKQLSKLLSAWREWRMKNPDYQPIFLRFFFSDIANQGTLTKVSEFSDCAYCLVQQAPLAPHTKVAFWCYEQKGTETSKAEDFFTSRHNGYTHYWTGNRQSLQSPNNSYNQTKEILTEYETGLSKMGINLADNCIRTWFFVQNVDVNYHGVVVARKDNFEGLNLTPSTHYIASTGIEGKGANPEGIVKFDAYAIDGIKPTQQQYLYAKDHLNPTYEYGVTFERGVRVKYGDRSHLFISGTASIGNKGDVLYVGDIRRQTLRMLENIHALLSEGGSSFADLCMMIVYLRDIADYEIVRETFDEEGLQSVPRIFVHAPVCRPTWLVETECIAISPIGDKQFNDF